MLVPRLSRDEMPGFEAPEPQASPMTEDIEHRCSFSVLYVP